MASNVRIVDGSWSWLSGVDSGKLSTISSELVPNGLSRDQLAWATNCTVRGGGITPRTGWVKLCTVHPGNALYQGGYLYDNSLQAGFPYLMLSIGGDLYQVRVDLDNSVRNISAAYGLSDPASAPVANFVQGEEFLVKQAGDGVTLPLIWDGNHLHRSDGPAGTPPGLPAATCMDYYMGRIWYAQDRQYTAGDIVLGPSGTAAYGNRDSILRITENPLALAGDGFIVPTQDGIIRALKHTANLDSALGEGQLYAFTRTAVYSLSVPVTRAQWITSTEPLQKVAQLRNGAYGERCIVNINGDLFYLSWDGYRSLFVATRDFANWGNTPVSRNINRILNFNDRSLLSLSSGIYFDNRMLQTVLPEQTTVGTAFKGLVTLDFDLVSSIQSATSGEKRPPAWEGWWQGVKFLQLFEGDYGGLQRAFATVLAEEDGSIQVWELTTQERNDEDDRRVEWFIETPAWTWGREFELKKLDGAEIWIDRVFGSVYLDVYYRPDAEACWQFWHRTEFCSARSTCEDVVNPICYPQQPYGECYQFPVTLPTPPYAPCSTCQNKPLNIGYQFQLKIQVKGWCRIRGIMVYAVPVQKPPFNGMSC